MLIFVRVFLRPHIICSIAVFSYLNYNYNFFSAPKRVFLPTLLFFLVNIDLFYVFPTWKRKEIKVVHQAYTNFIFKKTFQQFWDPNEARSCKCCLVTYLQYSGRPSINSPLMVVVVNSEEFMCVHLCSVFIQLTTFCCSFIKGEI